MYEYVVLIVGDDCCIVLGMFGGGDIYFVGCCCVVVGKCVVGFWFGGYDIGVGFVVGCGGVGVLCCLCWF